MVNRKIISAVIILSAGLTASYLIASPVQKDNKISAAADNLGDKLAGIKTPIQWLDNPLLENSGERTNITKAFAETIFSQAQSGKFFDMQNGKAADPGLKSQEAANEILGKMQEGLNFIAEISDKDILISNDNSKEAKLKYFSDIMEINKKDVGDFKKTYMEVVFDTYKYLDSSSASRSANIYRNLTADYLKIVVPSNLKEIHKQMIVYVKNSEILYSAMANYQKDPMKGYLVIEEIDKVRGQGDKAILEFLKEYQKLIGDN